MGSYLNPGSGQLRRGLSSPIYVDKSMLISKTNAVFGTQQCFVCLSRPRRFGKSMAADMLAAYYGRGEDASELFDRLKISDDPSYQEHLNRHDVIKINMQEFLSDAGSVEKMLETLQHYLLHELLEENAGFRYLDQSNFRQVFKDIYNATGRPFVIIIDEWDCVFREHRNDTASQNKYLDFLRAWLKDQAYIGLVYMTGILPIKKYGTHSALNMFSELSMTNPGGYAEFFGFTEAEVQALCAEYHMPFEEMEAWYDGYRLSEYWPGEDGAPGHEVRMSMYNPNSVVQSLVHHRFGTYWNNTETYEALKVYIEMGFGGKMKEAIARMLSGDAVPVDPSGFLNDMTSFNGLDDVLTLLVHLGYLAYAPIDPLFPNYGVVAIPNKEVSMEYITALQRTDGWSEVIGAVESSRKLLQSLWNLDAAAVAEAIDRAHESVSILQYNDENALSYTIGLAFYFAMEYYTVIRELPSGKGYADVVYIPRKRYADKPAVVVELKVDSSAEGAIAQIKAKNYPAALAEYHGNLLLCGINYDRQSKKHQCQVERMEV
ncbi:MAG: ATP-binding protein [Oscillospiraceae bacterium]|jgi:hypothetical protein|nr:ATP-binding protein [Oscillospiraceae bacterium]